MKIMLLGINYFPEEIGIGKYSGEMVSFLAERGLEVTVVTAPPYYPRWKISDGFSGWKYQYQTNESTRVVRCPLWVPQRVNGWKRILHLASFGLSSFPASLWLALTQRPDAVFVVEPAAFCLPTAWLAARISGARAWLHIQDFEVDAAFELGILKQPHLRRLVQWMEAFWMRRFDRVSTISPNMLSRLKQKGVADNRTRLFPNWVDCDVMKPLPEPHKLRQPFGIPEDKCIALYAGNIGHKQGLEIIVASAKRCADQTNIHFVICGHGAAHAKLVEECRGMSNLQLLPVQPADRFNSLMNCADIHLLPQRGDAADLVMPSKLSGMLATARPVVACAYEGTQIAEVVAHHGCVVAPGNIEAFSEAILQLATNAELRQQLGNAARSYALEHLGKDAILRRFAIQLEDLCRRPVEQLAPQPLAQKILEK